MGTSSALPIACDLSALSSEQRAREQALLGEFRAVFQDPQETDRGFIVVIPDDPTFLLRLVEFLSLERLCCPFLTFDLSIPAERRPLTLHIHGQPGVKSFLRSAFFTWEQRRP
jgi:hypothetical protein